MNILRSSIVPPISFLNEKSNNLFLSRIDSCVWRLHEHIKRSLCLIWTNSIPCGRRTIENKNTKIWMPHVVAWRSVLPSDARRAWEILIISFGGGKHTYDGHLKNTRQTKRNENKALGVRRLRYSMLSARRTDARIVQSIYFLRARTRCLLYFYDFYYVCGCRRLPLPFHLFVSLSLHVMSAAMPHAVEAWFAQHRILPRVEVLHV